MSEKRTSTAASFFLLLFRILFTGFALWTMYFIFSNSLELAGESAARSEHIRAILNEYLARFDLPLLTDHVVRKVAHFCEYAMLGFWYTLCLRVYTRHYIRHISWPLLLLLLVANVDETIQSFVAGRSSQLSDVWLDYGGGISGVLCGLLVILAVGAFFRLLGFGKKKK